MRPAESEPGGELCRRCLRNWLPERNGRIGSAGHCPRGRFAVFKVEPAHILKISFGEASPKLFGQLARQLLYGPFPIPCLWISLLLMFDNPPADLEVSDDLYRVDVLCYGQAGFPDDILDFSDERKNGLCRLSSGSSPCWFFRRISSSSNGSRSKWMVELHPWSNTWSVSITASDIGNVLPGVVPGNLPLPAQFPPLPPVHPGKSGRFTRREDTPLVEPQWPRSRCSSV